MYTEGSPVNYRDSSGHNKNNPMLGAIIGYVMADQFGLSKEQGAMLGGYAGSGKTNIGRDMDHGAKWAAKGMSGAAMNPEMQAWYMASASGMDGTNFAKMYFLGKAIGGTKKKNTWFGHNWTGPSNQSNFGSFNNENKKGEVSRNFLIYSYALGIPLEQAIVFLVLIKFLQPKPKSYADSVGQKHDGEVPSSNADFTSSKHCKHLQADVNYVRRASMLNPQSWKQPIDSFLVGQGGSLLFTIDLMVRAPFCIGR